MSFDQLFVMKLYASRPSDFDDMVTLWPLTNFESPDAAVRAYYDGFPHAAPDKHLVSFVAQIAGESSSRSTG